MQHSFSTKYGTARLICDQVGGKVQLLASIMGQSVAIPLEPNEADALAGDLAAQAAAARRENLAAVVVAAGRTS